MRVIDPSNDFGSFLKTRVLGARLREAIEAALDGEDEIRVDFSAVTGMAHGFADACFGDLFSEFGPDLFRTRLHLSNMNDSVKAVLRLVFADRKNHHAA